jgi:hypothetical protein
MRLTIEGRSDPASERGTVAQLSKARASGYGGTQPTLSHTELVERDSGTRRLPSDPQ